MFLPMDIEDLDKYYILILPSNYTREKFISYAKVFNNKYAGKIINEILDVFEITGTNVLDEYKKYYLMEFTSVIDFLYKHHNIEKKYIDIVMQNFNEDDKLLFGSATAGGDYNLADLMFEEKIIDAINKIFEGIRNEN
jgi:hypothetical protein